MLIDAIVLATELDDHGAPVEERVALPVNTRVAFLAVLVRDVEPNTEFEAEWRQNGETLGWSQHRIREETDGEQWIALRYAPEGGFSADKYVVRLSVNGSFVESLIFNAGGSGPVRSGTAPPRLVFTTDWGLEQPSIASRTSFEPGTQRVVAVLTNARGQSSSLTSYWYRGEQFFAEIASDPVRVSSTRTFTMDSGNALPPGRYQVSAFDGNEHVVSGSFLVQAAPGDETEAEVLEFVVTAEIDPASGAPATASMTAVVPPADLFGMVLVERLSEADSLEVVWLRNDQEVSRSRLARENLPRNWVTFQYSVPAEQGGVVATYRVLVLLNGVEVAQRQFTAGQPEAPEPTAEPEEPAETAEAED